ncbi:MAG: DUF4345 family protein [bacterium]|nr:DUF4345 family protein [bacterium]
MQIFLIINAIAYLALGLWCALAPQKAAEAVGFTLKGQQGIAEFVAVYGGLEFSIGLICLFLFLNPDFHRIGIAGLAIFYGSIVCFRSYALIKFGQDISQGWYFFGFEIISFILSLLLLRK